MSGKSVGIVNFSPSAITFLSMCFGLTSIRFAILAKWEAAVFAVMFSAILDGLDGRLARALASESLFGAQLDSLADLVSFGVAPAFIIYLWNLKNLKIFGWPVAMVFVICMAIRLARFNCSNTGENSNLKHFFFGLPAPAGALAALMPVMLSFNKSIFLNFSNANSMAVAAHLLSVAFLTGSTIPMFSLKHVKLIKYLEIPFLFFLAISVTLLINKPWVMIPLFSGLYLLSIPVSIYTYFGLSSKDQS